MNRLLLHGARYHDRQAVFDSIEGDTPDWRADRNAIRAGLALADAFGIGPADVVALFMPLSLDWAFVERGVWGLGATSLPIWPEWSLSAISRALETAQPKVLVTAPSDSVVAGVRVPDSIAATVASADLVERGGVLDTPERASRFRAMARAIPPETTASLEPSPVLELSHADWVERCERFFAQHPPRRGMRHVLEGERPELGARIVLHSGWADGFTTIVLGAATRVAGSEARWFVNLDDVDGGVSWTV